MCQVTHKIICDYLNHKLSRGTRGGRPWDVFESTDGSPFHFFFSRFGALTRANKLHTRKGELKRFGFIPKQCFSSLMEHKHQKKKKKPSCTSHVLFSPMAEPVGPRCLMENIQLSKAKYIILIHSSTFFLTSFSRPVSARVKRQPLPPHCVAEENL